MITSMIYSKQLQSYKPINVVKKEEHDIPKRGKYTKYVVLDNHITVGYIDVQDFTNGIYVHFIKNIHPELYSEFGKIADQVEVEHCLKRGLGSFAILSYASLNSHALHYERGQRFAKVKNVKEQQRLIKMFGTYDINNIVAGIINLTQKGKQYMTEFLGQKAMYMPRNIIQKYMEAIKKSPLLK